MSEDTGVEPIALIGLACKVPGARDAARFWANLAAGVESIRWYSREEQLKLGTPQELVDHPDFIAACPVLDDIEYFDAGFFGMTDREADFADPQHRLFLELAQTALDDAGYDTSRYKGTIGVYAGTGADDYAWVHLKSHSRLMSQVGRTYVNNVNLPDYVATLASYKLDLHGPSLTLHTACSTALVAVHLACEALRGGECDMALAGGVNIELPHGRGYVAFEGGIESQDGHCRPFDARATGTVWASGGGTVLLKRLAEAVAAGDHVRAVILGNAINNDGSGKVGFTAPSVEGQVGVVANALALAGIDPRSVSYIEAHGTGTHLGDPIEMAALTQAYGHGVEERGWCRIGSVKSNFGHTSQAAGIIGLIKTVLSLENELIPPSLNYESPNPALNLGESPFTVNAVPSAWKRDPGRPRRAGVSSFGIGGTNAHVILQEAPATTADATDRAEVLQISARSEAALSTGIQQLAAHLAEHPELRLSDVAHTLHIGRHPYPHRATVVATSVADAAKALLDRKRVHRGNADPVPGVAFLFSGQGAQHAGMAAQLYAREPVFREAVDACATVLGHDPLAGDDAWLNQTEHTQPALFTVEYALARLWESWGVRPAAMIGHSIGEYVAATLAGVFTLPDAVRLVARRGRLMQSLPPGSMLAVQAAEEDVRESLPEGLSIAVVNGPGTCVVAGQSDVVGSYADALKEKGIGARMLRTSHAFHSPMMEPILAEFADAVIQARPKTPVMAFLSNRTGDWITAAQATDPAYWAGHLRETVRFGDCVARLLADGDYQIVECGPGKQLAGLARMQSPSRFPLPSLPGPGERSGDVETFYTTAGKLWAAGVPLAPTRDGRRVPLPPYPFERTYHWIDPAPESAAPAPAQPTGPLEMERWCNVPVWRQLPPAQPSTLDGPVMLVAEGDVAAGLALGPDVTLVPPGADYVKAFNGFAGQRLVYAGRDPFFELFELGRALTAADRPIHLDIVTEGALAVFGDDLTDPQRAMAAGVAKVLPLEAPQISVRHIDSPSLRAAATEIGVEPRGEHGEVVALRAGKRWAPDYAEVPLPAERGASIRDGGVYLITGGLGGIGITIAEDLGLRHRARLVLLSRSGLAGERGARASAAIARIEAAGGEVLTLAADVTDAAALRRVREQILDRFGRLDGILHAAGLPGGGLIEVRAREAASSVIAPKVLGTQALAEAFGDLELDFVVLCGSITGVVGGLGQADYTAANAFLDAYANGAKGFRGRVISIDWGGWLELGMAAETARPDIPRFGGGFGHPILAWRLGDNEFGGVISPRTHWVLGEHLVGGVPVLPGTGHIEIARAAIAAALPAPGPEAVVELRDVAFLAPLAVPQDGSAQVRVLLEPADEGLDFTITTDGVNHVRGNGTWVTAVASNVDVDALREKCAPMTEVSRENIQQGGMMGFGPRWRGLKAFHRTDTEALARLEATDEVAAELDRWVLHPALLDEATSITEDGSYLPVGYGRITIHAPLPARFWSYAQRRTMGAGETIDLQLIGDDGRLLAEIADFVSRRVDASAMRQSLARPARPVPSEEAGIRPEQGAEIFRRLIGTDLGPQVIVNVRGMAESFARVRAVTTKAVAEGGTADVLSERASVIQRDRDFEAPRTELEAQLAEIWGTVLGVSGVARDDDFFDLGGNSLVAVQLVAQVRKATHVKLPMRSLFEASSVAAMAELVESLRSEPPLQAAPSPADVSIPRLVRPS